MPTNHRFKESDLDFLENNPPKGNYKILVVGTFNAAIEKNEATWFYGRPENEFWSLFPRLLNRPSLHPVDRDESIDELTKLWKQFCSENGIIIVDLFKTVNKNLEDHLDKGLQSLKVEEYELFAFRKAFESATFEKVLFTWKGIEKNTLTDIKNQYIQYFTDKGSRMVHLLTPSLTYSKPRNFKLNQWKIEFYNQTML
jgi:G:T/U-mismatch repair DNA glycosylase